MTQGRRRRCCADAADSRRGANGNWKTGGATITRCLFASLLLLACYGVSAARAAGIQPPKDRKIRVAVVMTEGATMIDFAGPWEVFQDVHVSERGVDIDQQMPFELFTVGASRQPIRTSGGMTVVPDFTFADAPVPDVVVVGAQRGGPGLSPWLRKVRGQARLVLSVCTGAFKLAEAGLLDGKRATTHTTTRHTFATPSQGDAVAATLRTGRRRRLRSGGLSSGIDLGARRRATRRAAAAHGRVYGVPGAAGRVTMASAALATSGDCVGRHRPRRARSRRLLRSRCRRLG